MNALEAAITLATGVHIKALSEDLNNEYKQGYVQGMMFVRGIVIEYFKAQNSLSAPSCETPTAGEFSGNVRNN